MTQTNTRVYYHIVNELYLKRKFTKSLKFRLTSFIKMPVNMFKQNTGISSSKFNIKNHKVKTYWINEATNVQDQMC